VFHRGSLGVDEVSVRAGPPEVTLAVEWLPGYPPSGLQPCDVITYEDGVEVRRERGEGDPSDRPGQQTSEEKKQQLTEVALRRAAATKKPAAVTAWASSDTARVADVKRGRLQQVGSFRVTRSPFPRLRSIRPVRRQREHRARPSTRATRSTRGRAPPGDPDLDDDPPPPIRSLRVGVSAWWRCDS
jgi:hypothetical protein